MDTYANLKTEVIEWLNREGFTELEAKVDTFLGMAQRRIFRTCDFHSLEGSVSGTGSQEVIQVPDDFQRVKALYLGIGGGLKEVTGGSYHNVVKAQWASSGTLKKYVRQGDVLILGPAPNQEYTFYLMYFKSLPLLSDSNTTNWFTDNAPELLLFGALVEAAIFLKDDGRAQIWQQRYEQTRQDIEKSEERSDKEYGGMAVRLI